MIFDWRRQGLSISAIARKTGLCHKTIRQHLKRGLENPVYDPGRHVSISGFGCCGVIGDALNSKNLITFGELR